MYPVDFDNPHFLEPSHSHDAKCVLDITSLPSSVTEKMSATFRDAILLLEESTSIAYSSFTRLQDLIQERFDHLLPTGQQSAKAAECGNISCKTITFL
jgi:hypothetical protein